MSRLFTDCLIEIFEYLENDNVTLRSCLLVNRLWCEVAVKILWRNTLNYDTLNIRTLVNCLPNESKEFLHENGIIISNPTLKPPMFNYASFCKVLSMFQIGSLIKEFAEKKDLDNTTSRIIEQEIYKLLISQISSLDKLSAFVNSNVILTTYPGADNSLKNLSELGCFSNHCSELFYQLSQICHNIQSLTIYLKRIVSNGLTDLIFVQKNMKCLRLEYNSCENFSDIISSLTNISNSLIKLSYKFHDVVPLSFIAKFTNLQEFILSITGINDFETLQYVTFSQLQILKIPYFLPKIELLINFLEVNGKTLKEICLGELNGCCDNSLNLAVAKFCPNLKKLSIGFKNNELETMKIVFNSCQYLESIKIWCGDIFLTEKEALEMVVNYSPKSLCELIFYYKSFMKSKSLPEELESFFVSWKKRVQQKLSLIIIGTYNNTMSTDENMKIIEKYIELGIVRKFKVICFHEYYRNEATFFDYC